MYFITSILFQVQFCYVIIELQLSHSKHYSEKFHYLEALGLILVSFHVSAFHIMVNS
jgi:hypothetical protein